MKKHRPKTKPVPIIGNDVWMDLDVAIGRGVTVGHGAVIGARAVVTKDVPPLAKGEGVPARIIGYRFDEATRERLLTSAWWDYDPRTFSDLDMADPNHCAEFTLTRQGCAS